MHETSSGELLMGVYTQANQLTKCTTSSGGITFVFWQALYPRIQVVECTLRLYICAWCELLETWVYSLCYAIVCQGIKICKINGSNQGTDKDNEIASPYSVIFVSIMGYSSLGKVFVMGDFKSKMQYRHHDAYMHLISVEDSEIGYGKHLAKWGYGNHLVSTMA